MSDRYGLGKAAEETGKLVKPVYEDLVQPSAREVGAFAGEAVEAILLPIREALGHYTVVVKELSAKVAAKVRDVPRERLVSPPANVAGPILEAVRFVPPDSPLHELYANLLARSMNVSTARIAHPAFVSVLNQLTPDEARLLGLLLDHNNIPVITVDDVEEPRDPEKRESWDGVLRNYTLAGHDAGCSAPELAPAYIDNLVRLGILESQASFQLADAAVYRRIEEADPVKEAVLAVNKKDGHFAELSRSFFSVTDFGRLFVDATVRAPAP